MSRTATRCASSLSALAAPTVTARPRAGCGRAGRLPPCLARRPCPCRRSTRIRPRFRHPASLSDVSGRLVVGQTAGIEPDPYTGDPRPPRWESLTPPSASPPRWAPCPPGRSLAAWSTWVILIRRAGRKPRRHAPGDARPARARIPDAGDQLPQRRRRPAQPGSPKSPWRHRMARRLRRLSAPTPPVRRTASYCSATPWAAPWL